jgi:hypothetical protein
MRRALSLAIPFVTVLACSSPGEPAKATPTVNSQQIIDRIPHDIWPAMSAYNADQAQAEGPASR